MTCGIASMDRVPPSLSVLMGPTEILAAGLAMRHNRSLLDGTLPMLTIASSSQCEGFQFHDAPSALS